MVPPLENVRIKDIDSLSAFIKQHSNSFEFYFLDHLTRELRFGFHNNIFYYCGFADGVRFYEALKKGEFDHDR